MMGDMKNSALEYTSVAIANDLVMVLSPSGHGELVHNPLEANALRLLANKGLLSQTEVEETWLESA